MENENTDLRGNFRNRVLKAQCALKAPKNQRNKFGNYNYRSCEDILEAAKPVCEANGLVLNLSDSVELVGDRFYVCATATLSDAESSQSIESTAYAREPEIKKGMDESQITGTASSYARKYALNGLFCIDDTKDADTDEYGKQTGKSAKKAYQEPALEFGGQPDAPVCACCGKAIQAMAKGGVIKYSVDDIVAASKRTYGKIMCWSCMTAEKKRRNEEEAKNAE